MSDRLPWYELLFLRFSPRYFLRRAAKREGIDARKLEATQEVFCEHDRIDFFPFSDQQGRSCVLVINRTYALFFEQNGDHFVFDGFEMGKYNPGDVTVFDGKTGR